MAEPTKAPSQSITFPRYARMKVLKAPAPQRMTIPYLKGPRRMFAAEEGFVGVTNLEDAEALKQMQVSGEILGRGGTGGDLFDVVDEQGLLETLTRENEQALLRGTGAAGSGPSVAFQNLLRLGRSPGGIGAAGAGGAGIPGMNARSAAEILAAQQASAARPPVALDDGVPTAPSGKLGKRRKGGAGAAAASTPGAG